MYYSERPDKWVILKITHKGEIMCKLLCGWYGGYLGSDEWKLSSQINDVFVHEDEVYFHNQSGSVYLCDLGSEGTTNYSHQKYLYFKSLANEDTQIDIIKWSDYEKL